MADAIEKYIKKARAVLDANWTGSYTMPAASLYPHQWNWDSGFIAIGYSRYDTKRAIKELTSLFNAQWKNGLLPQIVFDRSNLGRYFPEPDTWQAELGGFAPEGALTSGITMPPVHGLAALRVYENARAAAHAAGDAEEARAFLRRIYPRLLAFHRYIYRERDPDGTGLAYIRHPWESGMDNSPMWDAVFEKAGLRAVKVPDYTRKDLEAPGVSAGMRPSAADYDRFVYLIELFKRHRYDERAIRAECPFLVCGPLFNAVLCASNEAIIKIADIIGEPGREAEQWYELTARAISERLFCKDRGIFGFYDLRQKKLLDAETAAGFMPLLSGAATQEQAARLYGYLDSASFCALHQGNCFSVPNYDTTAPGFDRAKYWRGPVWLNINWMLRQGLKRYGFRQKADAVARDIIELPMRSGFHEYFDSADGRGYGSEGFSWTAALFIDTAFDTLRETGERPLMIRVKKKLWGDYVLNEGKGAADVPFEKMAQAMLSTIKDIKAEFYTEKGTVDYDAMRGSEGYAGYRRLAARLRDFDPTFLEGTGERLAFWIDLYNTIVIDGIIALGIKSSVKEVMGFFSRVKYRIGEHLFSPDDMEHGILRGNARHPMHAFRQFGLFDRRRKLALEKVDPRVHFALVCGSRSCAPIKFYTPEGIDAELDRAALGFINSSEVIVIPGEKRIVMSKILKWYAADFGGFEGILKLLEKYLVDDDKKEFVRTEGKGAKIDYLPYDWNLNS